MATCFKLTTVFLFLMVCTQLEAKPTAKYDYNYLEQLVEALIQRSKPQPWSTHLQETSSLNELEGYEVDEGKFCVVTIKNFKPIPSCTGSAAECSQLQILYSKKKVTVCKNDGSFCLDGTDDCSVWFG